MTGDGEPARARGMSDLPSRTAILQWIAENPGLDTKRDIARAFGLKGADRIPLKALLKELQAEGQVEKKHRHFREAGSLPPVSVVEVIGPDAEGDLWARPLEWEGAGEPPRVLFLPARRGPGRGGGGPAAGAAGGSPG